jgi:hypothetical protein
MLYFIVIIFWPYLLASLVGIVVLGIGIKLTKIKAAKRAATVQWGQSVEEILRSLENPYQFTPARQRRECDLAIELLERIEQADPVGCVVKNPVDLIETLQSIKKTIPLLAPLKRADLAEFKGNSKQLLSACLDLLFLCETEGIGNRDLRLSSLCFNSSGEPLLIEHLHNKCVSLGWSATGQQPLRPSCRGQDVGNSSVCLKAQTVGIQKGFPPVDGAKKCPYCKKIIKTERGMIKHLMGTIRCGGHEFLESDARELANRNFES